MFTPIAVIYARVAANISEIRSRRLVILSLRQNKASSAGHALKPAKKKGNRHRPIEVSRRHSGLGIKIRRFWNRSPKQEEGIHVHVASEDGGSIVKDETFSRVTVDGVHLDEAMIRMLMAQSALPHIAGRVVSVRCPDLSFAFR